MKKSIILSVLFFGLILMGNAQTTETKLEPAGIFKTIDIARHNKAIELLQGQNEEAKKQIMDSIKQNPNYYNPTVFYEYSRQLFNAGLKYEASYWFYLAQLRARYDANLSADNSAKGEVSELNNEYGTPINQYAFGSIDSLKLTVKKVIDFVSANNENYDHRWINLYGMWAFQASLNKDEKTKELSRPKDQWPEIKTKTINDYYNGFTEALKSLNK